MLTDRALENSVIDGKRAAIGRLCRQYHVDRLELFGSGSTDRFDSQASDLDFVVSFWDRTAGYADCYFDLAEALEALFQRPVDLVTERSIRNPYFCHSVAATRQIVYDRRSDEAGV